MARTTPGTGIPVPESPDPRTITADLWASFSKVGQLITQTSGESSAALVTAEQAETAAAQALARALLIEDPIHVGPSAPTEGEDLWVDTDEEPPPTPVSVASEDITDATDVGRNVLTAPLTADGRRALNIWDGTRAHLDAGTDTAERTWEAKDLAEFVTDTVAAAGGAASWEDLTGKPTSFPPSAHTHQIAEIDGLRAGLDALTYSTGWRRTTPPTTAGYAFDGTGSIYFRRRSGGALNGLGDSVDVRFENVGLVSGLAPNAYLTPSFWLPNGFKAWYSERGWYLVGNVSANIEYKVGIVQSHRLRLSPDSPVPGTGSGALQGTITFPTDDPRPTILPGTAHTF